MRRLPLAIALLLAVNLPAMAADAPAPDGEATSAAAPDAGEIAKADELSKAGLAAMQASNGDTSRTVDAALAFSSALHVYERAGDHDKAREMQANIFWCKKRMNIDDLERFVAKKGSDPRVAADLARIEAVATKEIPADQADTYLADADRYALENPDQSFLIAVRYFEVAERFVGTPASIKAQRKSLDYQARATPAAGEGTETLFTRPAQTPQGRQPMPSAAEQKVAKDAVRKLYKDQFAERKDSARRAFSWRLFEQAKSSRDDTKMRHALLSEATQIAVSTRDIAAILVFSDELASGFEGVDATTEKRTCLTKIKTDPTASAVLKLLSEPRDPAANTTAGRYFCLVANQWDIGLPLLALGGDPVMSKIAKMEVENPSGAAQQMELADAWYGLGSGRSDEGVAAWKRAHQWYRKALPSLSGVSKERVEQALQDMFPTVIDPAFDFSTITDKQWDKLKGTSITVSAVKPKTDSGMILAEGERVRVVPHPSDTWVFHSYFSDGDQALDWRGEKDPPNMTLNGRRMQPMGSMRAWTKEGDQKPIGIISGPGKLYVGPNESAYAIKGAIRVKIITLE